ELLRCVREGVVPDALFRIIWPDMKHVFALEVDRTPPAPQAFARRLFRYQTLGGEAFGVAAFTLLVVGAKTSWVERAEAYAAKLRLVIPVWFSTFKEIESHGSW